MKKIMLYVLSGILLAMSYARGEVQAQSLAELITNSDAICYGSIIQNTPFKKSSSPAIYTATSATVLETFKGTFSDTVQLEHRGGELNGRGEYYCNRPVFHSGEEYLLFIQILENNTLRCSKKILSTDADFGKILAELRSQALNLQKIGADVSSHIASPNSLLKPKSLDVLPSATGYTSRFLQGDRGEPIEYLVDMDSLPAGISSNQAMTALSNAFAAWTEKTSLTFKFIGFESFGMAAIDVNANDGRIRIQLHDNYNHITSNTTLGEGGRGSSYSGQWPNGGLGGRVKTHEFDLTTRGFLTMNHTLPALSDPATLEEVLCHELGHVISMGHSSETEAETDAMLSDAIMYFQAHQDGRGASLQTWDTDIAQIIYPITNTPPYGYDRTIRVITSPAPQAPLSSGVNQVKLYEYDRQGDSIIPQIYMASTNNGAFVLTNLNTVAYTPAGYFGDSGEVGTDGYYDVCYIRTSDGVNLSPPIKIRIVQFLADGNRDQLPNSWAEKYGISGGAAFDDDGDGFSNLDEWFLGSNPTNPLSNFQIEISGDRLSWNARPNELYQVESTTDLQSGFSMAGMPIVAATTNDSITVDSSDQQFYRVRRLK